MATSEELIRLREHLELLEAFMKSRVYSGFLAARQRELEVVHETILTGDPVDRSDEIELFKLRGEKRCLEQMLKVFEDATEELRDRISELEDEEEGVTQPPQTALGDMDRADI